MVCKRMHNMNYSTKLWIRFPLPSCGDEDTIDAPLRGKASVVPGFMNALLAASTRLMPRQLAAMSADRFMAVGVGMSRRCGVSHAWRK